MLHIQFLNQIRFAVAATARLDFSDRVFIKLSFHIFIEINKLGDFSFFLDMYEGMFNQVTSILGRQFYI